jgi:hypothetical protein
MPWVQYSAKKQKKKEKKKEGREGNKTKDNRVTSGSTERNFIFRNKHL